MQKLNVDEVVSFLKSAPATVGEVAAKFSVPKQTANRVLANLRKDGVVAVVSSRNKGEHVRGRPEFLFGVLAPGEVVEAPVASVEVIDVPVVEAPMTDVVGPHGKLLSVEELADYSQPAAPVEAIDVPVVEAPVETLSNVVHGQLADVVYGTREAFSFDDTDRP